MGQTRIKVRKRNYTLNKDGSKTVRMALEAAEVIERQFQKFREKFGREPGPNDPIFFDEDADTPQQYGPEKIEEYTQTVTKLMAEVGVGPAVIYAFHKTGRMVSEKNAQFLTDAELQEWNDAVDE